jgi:predicted nucleic acid-binding protein
VAEDPRPRRGILDTSVVIDLEELESSHLPVEVAVTAITIAELAAGPHATTDPDERALRQDRLQRAEAAFDPLPFDGEAARAYGRIYSAVVAAGRKAGGARADDLLIAAIASSVEMPLYTRNADDFRSIQHLVDITEVSTTRSPGRSPTSLGVGGATQTLTPRAGVVATFNVV